MKLGKISLFILFYYISFFIFLFSEEKISTVPLVNLEDLKPSFEKEDTESKNILNKEILILKEKKSVQTKNKSVKVNIVALRLQQKLQILICL